MPMVGNTITIIIAEVLSEHVAEKKKTRPEGGG